MRNDIYKDMKKRECTAIGIPPREGDIECKPAKVPRLTGSVIFETDSGNVYDKDGNYIGRGTLEDGHLTIEMKPK